MKSSAISRIQTSNKPKHITKNLRDYFFSVVNLLNSYTHFYGKIITNYFSIYLIKKVTYIKQKKLLV